MKIAIPVAAEVLCMHFGHCEKFALIEVDEQGAKIVDVEMVAAPPHQPGLLPVWLAERGVGLVIAGGMGARAQGLFAERGIQVITGAPAESPEAVVRAHLAGTLRVGQNVCDH